MQRFFGNIGAAPATIRWGAELRCFRPFVRKPASDPELPVSLSHSEHFAGPKKLSLQV
jgi:hypothetical protein